MSGPYSRVCLLVWSLRLWSLRYENKVAKVEYTTYQQAEGCALLLGVAPAPGLRVHGCGDARRAHALPKLLVTKHVNRSPYSTKKGGKRPPTLFLFFGNRGYDVRIRQDLSGLFTGNNHFWFHHFRSIASLSL